MPIVEAVGKGVVVLPIARAIERKRDEVDNENTDDKQESEQCESNQ